MKMCIASVRTLPGGIIGHPCIYARKGPKRRYSWRRFHTPCLRCGQRPNTRQKP
jgi:hypothetical protein